MHCTETNMPKATGRAQRVGTKAEILGVIQTALLMPETPKLQPANVMPVWGKVETYLPPVDSLKAFILE